MIRDLKCYRSLVKWPHHLYSSCHQVCRLDSCRGGAVAPGCGVRSRPALDSAHSLITAPRRQRKSQRRSLCTISSAIQRLCKVLGQLQTYFLWKLLKFWMLLCLWSFQVVSTNMSFRPKPKSCWILSPGPCTRRKRWCKVGQRLLSLQFTFTALLWLTRLSFRSSSGSSSLTAATHWKNCATNWYRQVVKRLQWRSTCRVMQQRAPSPFRYTFLLTLEVLDKF